MISIFLKIGAINQLTPNAVTMSINTIQNSLVVQLILFTVLLMIKAMYWFNP